MDVGSRARGWSETKPDCAVPGVQSLEVEPRADTRGTVSMDHVHGDLVALCCVSRSVLYTAVPCSA